MLLVRKEVHAMLDKQKHHLNMDNRNTLNLTGVNNVDSFDSEEFLLETDMGHLMVHGTNLHIKNLCLEEGLLSIEGTINSLVYLEPGSHPKSTKSFFNKIFK